MNLFPHTTPTGRMTRRDAETAGYHYRMLASDECTTMRGEYSARALELFRDYAAMAWPDADMIVLRKYRCTVLIEAVAISVFSPDRPPWEPGRFDPNWQKFTVPLPEGFTIEAPDTGRLSNKWFDLQVGSRANPDACAIPGFAAMAREIEAKDDAMKREATEFKAFLATKPLRRAFVARYPAIAARMLWSASSTALAA